MKDKTIKAMAERVGQTRAEKFWALFVERLCDGIEPEDGDTFKREDIEKRFENSPVARDAFIAVLCGEQKPEPAKGRKFKAGRSYNAEEYANFYEQFPENVSLCEDIERATDGKPWVVFTTKFHAAQSAKFIGWHMAEDIAPATIDVDGVPVAPVLPGEERRKEAKEYPVDPHTPGGFLNVENKSPRTGADFTGYTEEEIQATVMAYPKLAPMDDLSLQRLTLENKGKGAAAILKPFAEIAAVWARTKPENRPKTKATKRPFVEPSAPPAQRGRVDVLVRPKGWIPTLCFLGTTADPQAWQSIYTHLAPLEDVGMLRITSDSQVKPGDSPKDVIAGYLARADAVMCIVTPTAHASNARKQTLQFDGPKVPVLLGLIAGYDLTWGDLQPLPASGKAARDSDERAALAMEIAEYAAKLQPRAQRPTYDRDAVYRAIVGLALDRDTLARSIDPGLAAQIHAVSPPSAQVLSDLTFLERLRNGGDKKPLRDYINAALLLSPLRRESAAFRTALEAL